MVSAPTVAIWATIKKKKELVIGGQVLLNAGGDIVELPVILYLGHSIPLQMPDVDNHYQ